MIADRPDRHVVVVMPKADLVPGFDSESVSQLLGDHNLAFGADAMSHTDSITNKWCPSGSADEPTR